MRNDHDPFALEGNAEDVLLVEGYADNEDGPGASMAAFAFEVTIEFAYPHPIALSASEAKKYDCVAQSFHGLA